MRLNETQRLVEKMNVEADTVKVRSWFWVME